MSFHHLGEDWNGILCEPRDTANSRQLCHTAHTWVQGNGRGNNLKGGRVSFIFFCVTSIKTQKYSTHTNQHRSAVLYLQLRLAASVCPPDQLPAGKGGGGGGQPYQQEGETRQEKRREPGRGRETKRKVKLEQ